MMRWLPLAAGGGAGVMGGIAGMPWGAQLALGLTGLAVYLGQQYLQYRLGSKALDLADRPGVPEIMATLAGRPCRVRRRHAR
jgi:hypothetical protein